MWRRMNWLAFALVSIAAVIQLVYWYPRLPAIVPSHFNAQGQVDGKMTKSVFFALMAGLQAFCLLGLPLLGKLTQSLPHSLINMPNKEYWLAESRREESLAFTFGILVAIAWITALLMLVVIQMSAYVAVQRWTGLPPWFSGVVVVYMIVVFGICGIMLRRFRLPNET